MRSLATSVVTNNGVIKSSLIQDGSQSGLNRVHQSEEVSERANENRVESVLRQRVATTYGIISYCLGARLK